MVYNFFDKAKRAGATRKAGTSVNEELAQELHKPVIKNSKERMSITDLKIIYGQQNYQKWNHYLLKIKVLNIYHV